MELSVGKILVVGASSDLAAELNRALYGSGAAVGMHYNSNPAPLKNYAEGPKLKKFQKDLSSMKACYELVGEYAEWAGGLDCIIQLSGGINRPVHWEELSYEDWRRDMDINLVMPFFLAQRAVKHMKKGGGRIILTSTASASHGGGTTSLAYGVAKSGIDCVVRRLAKDCAGYNILVNAVAPGFIQTKLHTEKMKRTKDQLEERIKLIPLKRSGTKKEFAGTVLFLLSPDSAYMTGQVMNISGGDWL